MSIITIRDKDGNIIEERKWRGGYRRIISATAGEQMNRRFGQSPFKNWFKRLSTEFGKVK